MAPKHITFMGPFTLDLTALQNKLVDVEEGGLQGFRTDMPGFQTMSLSLAESMPLHGAAAGIPQDIYDHFVMCNQTVDVLDERLAVAAKQLEVLRERGHEQLGKRRLEHPDHRAPHPRPREQRGGAVEKNSGRRSMGMPCAGIGASGRRRQDRAGEGAARAKGPTKGAAGEAEEEAEGEEAEEKSRGGSGTETTNADDIERIEHLLSTF